MLLFVGVEFLFAGWWFVSALAGGGVAEMFWVFCGCWFNAEGGGDIVGMSGVSAGVGWSGCGVLQLGWRLVVGSKAVVMWLVGWSGKANLRKELTANCLEVQLR